jgi:asparagine synthase (glutamine-hydrolysing)
MCGITGLYDYRHGAPVDRELLARMTDLLAHRGPDGRGEFYASGDNPGLGHRRLAIIDLVTGDQPMTNEDRSLWVVFNGEIYNYRELRAELQARGHRFATQSDTEVIVHAYEEWGDEGPAHLNGIFAYALWDTRRRRLVLARDHFGVKPLYWADHGGTLRFASELKALLADPALPRQLDLDALLLCLTFRHTPAPRTLLAGIHKLPPGGYLVADAGGVREGAYWRERPPIDRARSEQEWIEALADATEAAVARQMVADVPVGLSLSGGVDSTALLALMARHSTGPVRAFTVGFEGREDASEIAPAREMAARFGADFAARIITEREYAEFMDRYLWHLEEPIGNESAAAYHFVARMARESGVKVLLNGQGPDEAHAGYGRHLGATYAPWVALPGGLTGRLVSPVLDRLPVGEPGRRFAHSLRGGDLAERFCLTYAITSPAGLRRLIRPDVLAAMDAGVPARYVADQLALAPEGTPLERMTSIDARTSLPDNLLLCEDKMAMAAGVEARVPFLDTALMDIAERIPGRFKVRGRQGKWLHKQVCSRWVPGEVARRKKIGFDNAMDRWLRGALGETLRSALARPDSFARTYLNPEEVGRTLREHTSGFRDHQRLLFLILSLEHWHEVFLRDGQHLRSAA